MSAIKLSEDLLKDLRPLEDALQKAVAQQDADKAIEIASHIQKLFNSNRSHHRLLRAKLWVYEACVNDNRLAFAEAGLIGVRKKSNLNTRLYLEASGLLAIAFLRQKKIEDAKKLIRDVIKNINNIASDTTRNQFQKRFIERVEEECIFAELIGFDDSPLNVKEIEEKAIFLIQRHSDEEIYQFIGKSVPSMGVHLLSDVRNYSIKQLPAPDRKLLPPPEKAQDPINIGRTTFALLRRIAWKTFCKADSPIYKLWSQRVPKVFNDGYFAAAVVTTMNDYRIGVPMIASGLAALAMKYTAEEFCRIAKPKGIMIDRKDRII